MIEQPLMVIPHEEAAGDNKNLVKYIDWCAREKNYCAIYRVNPKNTIKEVVFSDLPNNRHFEGLSFNDFISPEYLTIINHKINCIKSDAAPSTFITKCVWYDKAYFRKTRFLKFKSDVIAFINPALSP